MRSILILGAIIVMVLLNGCATNTIKKEPVMKMSDRQNITYVSGNRSDFVGSYGCDGEVTMTLQNNGTGYIGRIPINWKLENGYAFIDVPVNRNLVSKVKKQLRKYYFDLVVVKNSHVKECMMINEASLIQAMYKAARQ